MIEKPNEFFLNDNKKLQASSWFEKLRNKICFEFELIESQYATDNNLKPAQFIKKDWNRSGGGGGQMSIMKGNVFEKVGVNISTVHGLLDEQFAKNIPGAESSHQFFATGISLVAHMCSPLVPAVHMNTRFITTTKSWFGGGADLNPIFENKDDTEMFHKSFEETCNKYNPEYYPKFKKWCDEYFFIKHRNESRGVGGIFYDYLDDDWQKNFEFTQDVGRNFLNIYPKIVRNNFNKKWNKEQRQAQLLKRGRYVEFNLVYDRGTKFGLMTGGNPEAILMSLPPEVKWD